MLQKTKYQNKIIIYALYLNKLNFSRTKELNQYYIFYSFKENQKEERPTFYIDNKE